MVWMIALVLTQSPDAMTYAVVGPHDEHVHHVIKQSWEDGWYCLCKVVGSRAATPPVREVADPSTAMMVVYADRTSDGRPAETYGATNPHINVFYADFKVYGRKNRGWIVAHELGHFYYGLPDEYAGLVSLKDCLMGNVHTGWNGKLCPECMDKVRSYNARR